jgi:hypothetical protein
VRLALLAFALLGIVACGDGTGGGTPTPQPARDPLDVAAEVPLRLEEMPPAWRRTPAGEDLGSLTGLSAACDVFDPVVPFPGSLATAASSPYTGMTGQQAQTYAAVYESDAGALADVEGTHDIVDRCGDEFKDVTRRAAEDQLKALGISLGFLGSVDVSLHEVDPPPVGETSAAYRVQVKVSAIGTSESFTVDYLVFQSGRLAAARLYATFGPVHASEQIAIMESLRDSAIAALSG